MKALNKYIKESILDTDPNIGLAGEDAAKHLAGTKVIGQKEVDSIQGLRGLKVLIIPEGVKEIDDNAFQIHIRSYMANFETLVLPSTLTRIGASAFSGLRSLKEVLWSKAGRNATIAPQAFMECDNLTSITIPEGVTEISSSVFENCMSLADISFPRTLTTIYGRAFAGCGSLTSIDLSRTKIQLVGGYLFAWCNCLEKVVLPRTCSEIGQNTFHGCGALEKVKAPGIKRIAPGAFYKCSSLTDVDITSPKVVFDYTSGGRYGQFENCMSLKEFNPIIAGTLSKQAFCGCIELESIRWDGHGGIENLALDNCRKLKEIHVPKGTDPNKIERLIEASGATTLGDYKVTCSI